MTGGAPHRPARRPRPGTRPRDELGRPLPHGAAGVRPLPDDLPASPRETLSAAQDLLDAGLYFQAHEVLERAWKAAPTPERGLWRGLTQIVVGLVHAARGNSRGASALLRRGLAELDPHLPDAVTDGDRVHGVDLAGVASWAEDLLARLEKPGARTGGVPPPPRLTRGHR